MLSPTIGVRSAASPFGNPGPSCDMLRFGRSDHQNLCQTLPKNPRGRESTPRALTNFDEVWTSSEFPVIRIPTRLTPVAAPLG